MLVEPYAIEHYASKIEKERLQYFRKIFQNEKEVRGRIYDFNRQTAYRIYKCYGQ